MYFVWVTVPIWFLIAMFMVASCFMQYDSVLKKLYQDSPDLWRELGRPLGFFWVPKEASTLRLTSSISRHELFRRLAAGVAVEFNVYPDLARRVDVLRRRYFYCRMSFIMLLIDVVCCIIFECLLF